MEGNPFVRYAAYSFSADGPIVSPAAEGMLVIPSAPHAAFNRALFLSSGEKLALEVLPSSGELAVEADGLVVGARASRRRRGPDGAAGRGAGGPARRWEKAAEMSVDLVVTAFPIPEQRAEVVAAFETASTQVHDEPGVELYALHEGPDRLFVIEKYESEQARAEHAKGAALADLLSALQGKLRAGLDVQVLVPHPAESVQKGVAVTPGHEGRLVIELRI